MTMPQMPKPERSPNTATTIQAALESLEMVLKRNRGHRDDYDRIHAESLDRAAQTKSRIDELDREAESIRAGIRILQGHAAGGL